MAGALVRVAGGLLVAVLAAAVVGAQASPALAADFDFGKVRIGTTSPTQTWSVQEVPAPGFTTVTSSAPNFTVVSVTCTPEPHLLFYSCSVDIAFAPAVASDAGYQTATITADYGYSTTVSGTGTYGPGASADPQLLDFGQVRVGSSAMLSTVVTNSGDEDLSFSLSPIGDYSFSGCTSTVAPGDDCTLTVTFSPSTQGMQPQSVHFIDPNVWGTNDLMLNGEGVLAYKVTSAANAGAGTLRDAILAANASGGPYMITFAIPGAGVHKIRITGALPVVTPGMTTIDGSTQPGFSGAPLVQLDNRSGLNIPGLVIAGGSTTVRGLDITGFGAGIRLESNGLDTIVGDRIGLDTTGAVVANTIGVLVLSSGNLIGGDTPADRNLISGNTTQGILLSGQASGSNLVGGNLIGTNAAGNAARPNGNFGVAIQAGSGANLIGGTTAGARNLISGNGFSGIGIAGTDTTGNLVMGNYIGTNVTGTAAISNGTHGVAIFKGASGNMIGGSGATTRNVISGNTLAGIAIYDANTSGNVVAANYIGTARDGSTALPNGLMGIAVLSNASGNTIGGTTAGFRNLVSGNAGVGILISGPATSGNIVVGNYIGTDKTGASPLPNTGNGVTLFNGANGNTIGGLASGEGNVIKNNTGAGVAVDNTGLPNTAGNSILRNSIDLNGGLGIALLGGANNGQPAPTILSVTTVGGTTTTKVALAASPSTQYRIQLFTSPACDSSLAGEAATFRSGGTTTTNAAGTAVVDIVTPALPPLQAVTASATNTTTGDTSQLSICATS